MQPQTPRTLAMGEDAGFGEAVHSPIMGQGATKRAAVSCPSALVGNQASQ